MRSTRWWRRLAPGRRGRRRITRRSFGIPVTFVKASSTPESASNARFQLGGLLGRFSAMPSLSDFPARGKVIDVRENVVVFCPHGTSYELHLRTDGPYDGPRQMPVLALIRAAARKVYTVPSGGNFIAPIFGPPRIVQGRVRFFDERAIVVQAGAPTIVDLPGAEAAIELTGGQIQAND